MTLSLTAVATETRSLDAAPVPLMRPLLPTTDVLLPYLREIDATRLYSNSGPLTRRLEERFGAHFDAKASVAVNATFAIAAALIAQAPAPGSLCLLPSWTFAATPHAVLAAGLIPYFIDVRPSDGCLDLEAVPAAIAAAPGPVSALCVVAPYGAPLDAGGWSRLADRLGLALVVDSAAGFDTAEAVRHPQIVSLHATKALASGEGGLLFATDADLVHRARRVINYGFEGGRRAMLRGFNGKMSEYHAAVGLAALDGWPARRRRLLELAHAYRQALQQVPGIALQDGWGESWISATAIIDLGADGAAEVEAAMGKLGISCRRWWGEGCHTQPAFASYPRTDMPVTEALARRQLGLPFFVDLSEDQMSRVAAALRTVLGC